MFGISSFHSASPVACRMYFGEKETAKESVRFDTNPFQEPFQQDGPYRVRKGVMALLRARASKTKIEFGPGVQLPDVASGRGFKTKA